MPQPAGIRAERNLGTRRDGCGDAGVDEVGVRTVSIYCCPAHGGGDFGLGGLPQSASGAGARIGASHCTSGKIRGSGDASDWHCSAIGGEARGLFGTGETVATDVEWLRRIQAVSIGALSSALPAADFICRFTCRFYLPKISRVKVSGIIGGRGLGCSGVAAGVGPKSALTRYRLWLDVSSSMVRAPRCVVMVSTTLNLSGESSCATVTVPSPHDANAKPVAGSKRLASTP